MSEPVTIVALIGQLGHGGSERQLFLTMTHLDPDLFRRHIVVFNPSHHAVYDVALQQAGVTVWAMPATYRRIGQRVQFLASLLRQLRADVVHSWTVHDNPYAGIAGWLARVSVRWGSVRGSLQLAGFQSLPIGYRFASLNLVSRLVVNATSLQRELREKGIRGNRIVVLPNAVTIHATWPPPADLSEWGITSSHRVVGTVGNLRCVKNHHLFVGAVAKVINRYPDVRGLIVGQAIPAEAELPGQLQAHINELGMNGRIVLTGFCADVPALLQQFDFFCLTSRNEGTSNAVLEAMAMGKPVVATGVGGMVDIIQDGKTGMLVASEDEAALVERLSCLLDRPAYARQLGAAAQHYVTAHHSCPAVSQQLAELYQEALER